MFNGKIVASLLALVVAVFAISNFNNENNLTEGFGFGNLPSMKWKRERVAAPSRQAAAKGDFYSVPGQYQSILNPRFANVDFGANIRYNMPSHKNMGVPKNPLDFANMVESKENFSQCGSCTSPATCGKGGANTSFHSGAPLMQGDFASGNYNDLVSQENKQEFQDVRDMIPVGDMTTINAQGETVQPIVYDRFIYANRNSRLRSQGDPIRGDLPIVPCSAEWFRPSVHPTLDLHEGAMNVMGGFDNTTSRKMAALINKTSGDATIGGINLHSLENEHHLNEIRHGGVNMSSMRDITSGNALADINVTAFP